MTNPTGETAPQLRRVGAVAFQPAFSKRFPLYARNFFASIILQTFAVMGLVEAIFLAERFPMVFRDVLKNNADLLDTSLIFLCNSTQIFDLGLAIAILMAVYWTTLRMREERELLVLFNGGVGPYQLIGLTLAIALAAQVSSLAVSGVIDPLSRYAQREILFDAKFNALRTGISTGQFYFFSNRVVFAPERSVPDCQREGSNHCRSLFVYEDVEPGTFKVITADSARLDGPDRYGNLLLKLAGFTSRTFSDSQPLPSSGLPSKLDTKSCADCPDQQQGTLYASEAIRRMNVDELLPFSPRGSETAEWTIFEQILAKQNAASARHRDEMRLLGERLARSFLCLLAPLIALASVCLTSRATNYLALPLACMALMSLDVTSEWLVRAIAPERPVEALSLPVALMAMFMTVLVTIVVRKQGSLIRPQLARA